MTFFSFGNPRLQGFSIDKLLALDEKIRVASSRNVVTLPFLFYSSKSNLHCIHVFTNGQIFVNYVIVNIRIL